MENDKHIISIVDVWQSQSYWPLNGWGAPNKSLGSTPHFWVPSMQITSDTLPEALAPPANWTWTNQWTVDKTQAFGAHDADGWYYGPSFERLAEIILKRSGAEAPSKTSLVRRRRWLRSMRCSSEDILEQVNQRIEKVSYCRKNMEVTIREKEESLRSIQFYEENRAFVFDQSLGLATQGTVATMTVLKDLFFKLKRLHQFITERAQVELEYSAKIEALGFKYSNSMTQAAQNPLLAPAHHHTPQKAAAEHTAVDAKGTPQASVLSATPSASTTSSAAAASTPSTLRSSFASLSNATGRLGMAGVNSLGVLSATKATPVAAAVVAPAHKDGISPLMEDLHSDMDSPSHGVHNAIDVSAAVGHDLDHEPDSESTYLNRDASAVLFNSLAAVHITAAERMKQFSKTMKHAAVTELEHVLTQIAKLLKEAKATFRKNSDICQLCDGAAKKCFDSAAEALESAVSASTAEMLELVDEMSALRGNIPTTSAFNTAALNYTATGTGVGATGGVTSPAVADSAPASASRRTSFISSPAPVAPPKGRQDTWLSIQRYRQAVRDSQEAMCVLITEYMDLELHQQILCNKVYSLFLTLGKTYHREQTALWEESLQIFGNLLGDTIGRIEKMGRPNPVLQSPFAKLQAAEEAFSSAPSTPVKGSGNNSAGDSRSASPSKGGRVPAEIQYEDFASGVGVFSFVVLYKDPLPLCPSVCLSGEVLVAKGRDFVSSKGDVLSAGIWKTVYAVVTSDGYLHLLSRGKCDIPDVSFCIKRCVIQSFSSELIAEPYAKVVLGIKPTVATETQVKNGAQRGEDYYLRLADEEQLSKWRNIILDPASAPVYVDTEIEEEAKQAMLRSIAIIRGETEKIDLSLNKYTADLMVPSLAAVAGAPVFSTPSSTKYDAFKHRTFIYDEEEAEQIDASAAMTPETHLVGRARRDTADSLSMDFAQSVDLADGEEGNDSEVDNPAEEGEEREAGRGDDDEDEAVTTYDESAEAGAGSVVVDNAERVGATVTSDANDDAVPAMVDSTDSPGKVAMYKLAGGQQSRARTHKEPREHRPLPHTSSGNALEKPAQGTGEISAYKFGSQYQKGGDSWIKKESSSAGSTIKGSKGPKQIIPVADNKQPLARRHSSMINQYETGLQEEKKKVEHRVKETKRRMIQDVVSRVILEGDEQAAQQLEAHALLEDPASAAAAVAAGKTKKVKEIAGKFGAGYNSSTGAAAAGGVDVADGGLILVVSTIVIVVLWMNSKANSKSKNNDKQAYATQKTHPKAPIVSQTRTECAQTHVEDEVTVTDDNLLEQEVVWEEIEGVQIVDDGEQERHNEVPGETSNEVDTAEERQEEYYEEEDGNLGETRDSEIGADGGNESPRESESEISPATPEVSNSSMGKRSPPKRLITRTFSSEGARSVSPSPAAAGGKTMYKFGSHYKKGGDSWVMNQNSEATAAAASPVGVSPVRTIQLKKIIPVHNDSQPLSRKQSDKISQYEAGLEQEKQKVSSRVLETRRRTIQDVVSRVILDGEGAEVPAEIDPIVLLVDPTVEVKTKKIVKQMAVKFSAAPAAAGESVILLDGADRRESVDLGTASGQGSSSSDGATTVSEKSDEGAV